MLLGLFPVYAWTPFDRLFRGVSPGDKGTGNHAPDQVRGWSFSGGLSPKAPGENESEDPQAQFRKHRGSLARNQDGMASF